MYAACAMLGGARVLLAAAVLSWNWQARSYNRYRQLGNHNVAATTEERKYEPLHQDLEARARIVELVELRTQLNIRLLGSQDSYLTIIIIIIPHTRSKISFRSSGSVPPLTLRHPHAGRPSTFSSAFLTIC